MSKTKEIQKQMMEALKAKDSTRKDALSLLLSALKAKAKAKREDLTEAELTEMARFATTAASLSTEHFGGISSIPDLETVLDRIART